ncbi:MAG: NADH-quinone oxidoreductase subunit G, partial [Mycobacterium sp.]|nr:NADH-quinone oxidoreductase subunit G [Mycobacterium sp.]
MTQAPQTDTELVTITIDDTALSVPKGTLVIRAAELIGVQIPRFCDHPLLDPVGACRQCLVDVEGQRKPLASCTTTVTEGMVVRTQCTSAAADKAQQGVMELLLINHPLDCPVCDKGGECPLQNQAMSNGRSETRFTDVKRTFPKPISLSSQVLLDRERCVLCARCTRFSNQIAGDPFIELLERGALQQVGIAPGASFDSYFSGNTVQICPVGALTGTAYRFRARPFDLVSSPSVCEHCASGCAQRTDHRRGVVLRRLAGDDPQVNEEWNCDKGRWAFAYTRVGDRITTPMVRGDDGALRTASWSEAVARASAGLAGNQAGAGLAGSRAGVLVGGRCTTEDAYAYAKFARTVLGTNDIDFRSRPLSTEETDFLTALVAGQPVTVSYADLESATTVVLAGLEPEEESPIVFLRLRKAVRKRGLPVLTIAPFASRGTAKLSARLIATPPGREADALGALAGELDAGAVILAGERLAAIPGALSAAALLAQRTGARLAWIPRRAGGRGALDAGCLPTLLPGGHPVADPDARQLVTEAWQCAGLPAEPGRDTNGILAAAA